MVAEQKSTNDIIDRIKHNPMAFIQGMSVHYTDVIDHAEQFWVTGSKVESSGTVIGETHEVILPLKNHDINITSDQLIKALHRNKIPAGCIFTGAKLTGIMDTMTIQYACNYADTFMAGFEPSGDNSK